MTNTNPSGDVEITNTAINMISTMHGGDDNQVAATVARVVAEVQDASNVKRLNDYPDVFVARGHGLRVIFKKLGGKVYVTTVAKEG